MDERVRVAGASGDEITGARFELFLAPAYITKTNARNFFHNGDNSLHVLMNSYWLSPEIYGFINTLVTVLSKRALCI